MNTLHIKDQMPFTPYIKIIIQLWGAGGDNRQKHLPHKPEDPRSIPRTCVKRPDAAGL